MLDERGVLIPGDVHATFRRDRTGQVTQVEWREGAHARVDGYRVSPHRNEAVTFRNGQVTLQGTLTVPDTPGRHPVVVLLHEAGPRPRPFGMWPYLAKVVLAGGRS
jgi:hypothetical protein